MQEPDSDQWTDTEKATAVIAEDASDAVEGHQSHSRRRSFASNRRCLQPCLFASHACHRVVRRLVGKTFGTSNNAQRTSPSDTAVTKGTIKSYDGLRGIACFIVFNFHFLYPYTNTTKRSFGLDNYTGKSLYFHQLPIICLIFRGRAMVSLFFGISGYVLSYHYLTALLKHSWAGSHKRLASLAFRRWARLFIPPSITMLIVAVSANIGAYDASRAFVGTEWITGSQEPLAPRLPSLGAQLRNYSRMWWWWSSPWTWNVRYPEYDPHTWTIPVEFQSSLVVFMVLIATSYLKYAWRLVILSAITAYCFAYARSDVAVFLGGCLVASIHQYQQYKSMHKENLPQRELQLGLPSKNRSKFKRVGFYVAATFIFVGALYMISFPDEFAYETPGYRALSSVTPPAYNTEHLFWQRFGAIFVLWAIEVLPPIRRVCESRIPQYLGRISYALYLVHGPILAAVGLVVQRAIWEGIGYDTNAKWCGGLILGYLTMLAIVLPSAHLFWKFVDVPLVRLVKQIDTRLSL